ncbi:hypothetical protein B5M07_19015 (plasmid) [Sulfitobacter sp. D7]|nr:hypothetical protein B5M07_19015 [Sulfitobacter sp. D7]
MQSSKPFKNKRLTYRLDIIAQEAIAAADDIAVRETGCRIRDIRVLRLIDDAPGTTFAEISKIMGYDKSLTSRIIRNLISKGLIQRENSEEDARVFFLSTTTRGKEVRLTARRVSDNLDTVLTDPLSAEDLRQLDDILARLGRWVTSGDFQAALTERV